MHKDIYRDGPFIFRLNENGTGPQLLTQVCLERGWREYNPDEDRWNLWWKTTSFTTSHHRTMYAWQFINHIPKGAAICRKDNLARYLKYMRKIYGAIYDFSPHGYDLPLEYSKLAAECSRLKFERDEKDLEQHEEPVWIYKPVSKSQGRGIFLFRKLSDLAYDSHAIVQRYIEDPLLIGGYKFDLRLYVCIPSYYPLTVYVYREGLARFGTDKFNLHDLRNLYRHLTNTSLNKLGPGYSEMKERIGSGCKWTFRQLRRYFQQVGISDWLLWQRISTLIVLTLLSNSSQVPPSVNCFEFFGFDVLIDSELKPWLLEVNLSPALGNDCDADWIVKKPMLHDLFDLLGLPLYNTGLSIYSVWNDNNSNTKCICCDNDNNNDEKLNGRKRSAAISVVQAAGKWRRRQKKHSAGSRSSSASRIRSSKTLYVPNKGDIVIPQLLPIDLSKSVDYRPNFTLCQTMKKSFASKLWGNGRNWEKAPTNEGDWIRVWPMDENGNKSNIKNMVADINKFIKTAKDIPKKFPTASDTQWNEILKESLNMSTDIWLPLS